MRGGNHGKIRVECSIDPAIARALVMLRAIDEDRETVRSQRLRRYVAEMIETYVPAVFQHKFGISIHEFQRRFPAPVAKELPGIAQRLSRGRQKTHRALSLLDTAQHSTLARLTCLEAAAVNVVRRIQDKRNGRSSSPA